MKLKDTAHFIKCHSLLHKEEIFRFSDSITIHPCMKQQVLIAFVLDDIRIQVALHCCFKITSEGWKIRTRQGEFNDVTPIEGTVVLNIGDMLESWSRNRFESTQHRVVHTKDTEKQKLTRRTIAYFVQPDDDVLVDEEFVFEGSTLLKFLGPPDPKNPGQRPLTQNFWVKVFWSLHKFGSVKKLN